MIWLKTAAAAAALGLAACAALAPEARLAPAPSFDFSGRMLVTYDGRAFTSGVRWLHAAGRDEIWLLTPVGQALAHIVNEGSSATLTAADQKQYQSASVESLTRRALGWELPLARLQYWVRGEVAPGSAPGMVERDANERLVRLEQDGWRIVFTHYPPEEQQGLPRRLDLDQGANAIRMVIDGWRTPAAVP
jgi:outer membrane lipoprotein LolB